MVVQLGRDISYGVSKSAKVVLVWRFRSPHHFCGKSEMWTSEPKPH